MIVRQACAMALLLVCLSGWALAAEVAEAAAQPRTEGTASNGTPDPSDFKRLPVVKYDQGMPTTAKLKARWEYLNDRCRGGGRHFDQTGKWEISDEDLQFDLDATCGAREEVGEILKAADWCFDPHAARNAWKRCKPGSN